jgi:hypothetical protein
MAIKRKMNLGFGTNPDAVNLTALPPSAEGQLNGVIESGLNGYQLVRLVGAGPSVAGDVGYLSLTAMVPNLGQCTRTFNIGTGPSNLPYGVFTTAVALNNYTLVKQRGTALVLTTAANLAAANVPCMAEAGATNAVVNFAVTGKRMGTSLEARGDTVAGYTTCFLDLQSY